MEIRITDLGNSGEGIGRIDGKVCFVPFTLPNELVEVEVVSEDKKFCTGLANKIIEKSDDRQVAPCPYFEKCGGCDLQHLKYEKQLEFKQKLVKDTLKKIANIECEVGKTISGDPFDYRNKMAFPVGYQNNKTIIGMFKKKSHEVVEIKECLLTSKGVNEILNILRKFIEQFRISAYDYQTKQGLLKYVVVRQIENKFSIILVVTDKKVPNLNKLIELLPKNIQLYLNINKEDKQILSRDFVYVFGEEELVGKEFGVEFSISPYSFMQVNDQVKEKMYNMVLDEIDKDIVVDAYSGAGMLSAIMSRKAPKVYGIEIARSATIDANKLIERNLIKNVTNINGDCEKELPLLVNKIGEDFTLVLDPPRSGVDEKVIKAVNKCKAKKIIYISCNPSTLARDLMGLTNFKIKRVQPFDMFPQTANVESLVVLEKH